MAQQLEFGRDFTIDRTVRSVDLTQRGQDRLDELSPPAATRASGRANAAARNWSRRRCTARHCFIRDEQYLIAEDGRCRSSTNSPAASWPTDPGGTAAPGDRGQGKRPVTADKENLARLSFQRFFRQYPHHGGMTGTAWESAGEMWQIYQRPIVRIPTNKPCIRQHLPTACSTRWRKNGMPWSSASAS
jgi:preprotein translocase subunit SecA